MVSSQRFTRMPGYSHFSQLRIRFMVFNRSALRPTASLQRYLDTSR
jgi:hypothetical protein